MKSYSVTIQMKATEQYFPVVLFIMLYKVVLTFKSVDGTHNVTNKKNHRTMLSIFIIDKYYRVHTLLRYKNSRIFQDLSNDLFTFCLT